MHGSKAASVEEALTHIRNGQTIMLSGFTNVGSPNKFIVKMAEAGITDSTSSPMTPATTIPTASGP